MQYVTREFGVVLSELGPGQYFGDLAMLMNDYHVCSVRAKTHVEVCHAYMHMYVMRAAKAFYILCSVPMVLSYANLHVC